MIKTLFAAAAFTGSFFTEPSPRHYQETEAFMTPGITAVYDGKKKIVNITWQQKTSGIKTFIIQRSNDNFNFTDIVRMENAQFNSSKIWQYADINPGEGENYYRLQCIAPNGKIEYSTSVMIIPGGSGKWVMYPVPVSDLLTLQYKGIEKITGVINIIIQTIQGKILTRLRCASNNTIIKIPVNNLGKGVYDIRIMIEDEIVWNQRFVK
jgi:hypothetical protein